MKSLLRGLLFFAIIALFVSCSDTASDNPVDSEVTKLIKKVSDSLLHDIKVAGYENIDLNAPLVVIEVVDYKSKKTYSSSEGWAEIGTQRLFDKTDLFRVGSITKTFVSTEVLILADRKYLSLDDTLSKFNTQIPNANQITIRHLLNMTAGINDFATNAKFRLDLVSTPLANKTPEELVDYVSKDEPANLPGEKYHYSSTNYILLGIIIEKVTGKNLHKCIEDDILTPLQLKNTYFPTSHAFPTGRNKAVCGYYFFNAESNKLDVTEMFSDTWAWGSGAMISCISDLQIWGEALANASFLSQGMKAERDKTVPSDLPYMNYGLGLMISNGYYGHSGFVPGYTSAAMYSPERDVSIIVLINYNMGSSMDIFHRIAMLLK